MLCGHIHSEARRTDGTLHTLLANYQDYPNGGNGFLRILHFSPEENEIQVKTYSPWLNQYETDSNSQFVLSYDMGGLSSLTVVSPNGGEELTAGTTHEITWTSQDGIDNVKIEYSVNNGYDWIEIVASTDNDGSYDWDAPCYLSEQCLVKISSAQNSAQPYDVSDQVFSITGNYFSDVPIGYWAEDYIYQIFDAGITKGCSQNPLKYCPYDPVTRAQMAAFIVRAVEGEPDANYCDTGSPFSDVPTDYWACKYIKRLSELEITTGCGPGIYCPNRNVIRAQMAAFLIRAVEGEPPADYCDTGSPFSDVSPDYWACKYIKRLSELGITKGCGGTNYCPNRNVTRAEMAAFLARAFIDVILSDALYNPATGHWYQLNDTKMTWDEAKTFAESRGGYLATITSAAEGQYLYDAFGSTLSIVASLHHSGIPIFLPF
jgi:hypothetical protein